MDKTKGVKSVKDKINREPLGPVYRHYRKQRRMDFFRQGANLGVTNRVLLEAIENNDKHIVQDLVAAGVDPNMGNVVEAAALGGDKDILTLLLEKGADVNKGNVVEAAALGGDKEILTLLLEKGADVNKGDVVEAAAWRGDKDILTLVLEKGAGVNKGNVVEAAALVGDKDILTLLLEKGADVNKGDVVEAAIRGNDEEILTMVLEKGADVNKGKVVETAVREGRKDLLKLVLEKGADVNKGNVAESAAWRGDKDILTLVLEKGADVNKGEVVKEAAQTGDKDILTLLLEKEADVNKGDVVDAAVRGRNKDILTLVLEKGANVNKGNVVNAAVRTGRKDILTLLLEKGTDVNKGDVVEAAVRGKNKDILTLVLEKGAYVNRGNVVEAAAVGGDKDILTLVLEKGADVNKGNVVEKAAENGDKDMLTMVIEKGADVNKGNVVEAAVRGKNKDILALVLEKGADVNKGNVVEAAAVRGDKDILTLVLEKGADVNKGNVVEEAAENGDKDMLTMVIEKGADVNKGDVIKAAISHRDSSIDMIRLLIDKGADIKKSDALSKAISFGHGDIVSLLLENGDDPEKLSEEHMLRMTEVIARHQENVRLQQQEYSKGISGTVENPCNITIAVVGHQGVGKSCLVKQLIRESIPEGGPGSTDTADFYVNYLTYNPKTGFRQKLDENGEVEAGRHRIKLIIEQFRKGEGAKKRGYDNVPDRQTTETKETYTEDSTTSEKKEARNKESAHTDATPEVKQDEKELPKEQREVINKIMRKSPKKGDEDVKGFVTIFDFGGECVFYNTHHCFLSSNMVFVLVIDVNMCLDPERSRSGYEIAEYWLKNIATYFLEDKTEDKRTPPIIIVGSHLDMLSSDKYEQRKLFADVLEKLHENQHVREIIENHVQEMFAIANLHDSTVNQDVYEELWQKIMEIAPLQSQWKKAIPSKWVAFEHELIRLKNKGRIILKYDELLEVNSSLPVPLLETEIFPFLKNLKYTGTFLCFNLHTKHPFIVIQPQWIIDAFKQIITDQRFKGNLSYKLLARWSQYAKSGVLPMDFARQLWGEERFRQNFETLCIVMESLSLLAKPIKNDPNTEVDYFIVPCMLPTASQEFTLPFLKNAATTVVLCLEFNTPFIPRAIWDKLITSCIHRFEKIQEPEYNALEFIHRELACLKVNAAWNMIIHCKDNAVKVMMFTLDNKRATAGVGVSLCSILENLLQRILKQNHQGHLEYQFYLHNDYRFTAKDKMVKVDDLKTFESLECFGNNGRTMIKNDDIYVWFKDPTGKVGDTTTLSADLSAVLPKRKLTLTEIGRVSKYIGSAYQTFFVGLGCPSHLLEQEMEEHRHLAFRSRITKILIQLTKQKADLRFGAVAKEMLQNGMDPKGLIKIIDCNEETLYKDDRLPDGWLHEKLSVNDVPVIARYISVKAYFNMFVELGFQPEVVDSADFKCRNKPEHILKALLETFITETHPPPTRNTILLAMQECDMDMSL